MTPQGDKKWGLHFGAASAIPKLLRQFGVDSAAILRGVGLSGDALDDPGRGIAFAALCRLYRAALLATGSPHFGLLAGQARQLADLGLVGDLARNSPTVGEALRNVVRFNTLHRREAPVFLLDRGEIVDFGCVPNDGEPAGVDLIRDSMLAVMANILRALCSDRFVPNGVLVARARPADPTPWRCCFQAPLHFEEEYSSLRFPSGWMNEPVEGADPVRFRELLKQAVAEGPASGRDEVAGALRILLADGVDSGDEVARCLGLHRRTLSRRLRAEHTTFQHTLDEVRFDAARRLLAGTHVPMDDVAASLGYDNVSSFQRRFRQWARTTPGEWRRMMGERGMKATV